MVGAVNGTQQGIALAFPPIEATPCSEVVAVEGTLYISLSKRYSFVLTTPVHANMYCPGNTAGPQVSAQATLPELMFSGIHFSNVSVSLIYGNYLDASLHFQQFINVSVLGSAAFDVETLELSVGADWTFRKTYFTASAVVNSLFGDSGAIDGSTQGAALVTSATLQFPCVAAIPITGQLFINLPAEGFTPPAVNVSGSLACDQTSVGVHLMASATVSSITYAGLSFHDVGVAVMSGTYAYFDLTQPPHLTNTSLDGNSTHAPPSSQSARRLLQFPPPEPPGPPPPEPPLPPSPPPAIIYDFVSFSITGSLTLIDSLKLSLALDVNRTHGLTSLAATANVSYTSAFMTSGRIEVGASLSLQYPCADDQSGTAYLSATGLDGLSDVSAQGA